MNSKVVLVLIALVGTGIFALPQTMALFAGQHSFYNIDPTGNQVPCQKCHGDVQAELSGAVNNETGTKPPHADMKCEFCHRLQIGRSAGDNVYAIITYSDAVISNTGAGGKTVASKTTEVRYAIVNPADYEAGAYPKYMNDTDVWSGLAGSHGHSVALNPRNNGTGPVVCTYPECDMSDPTVVANLFFAKSDPINYSKAGLSVGAISVSPTFNASTNAYIAVPPGKVLNAIGTTLCGGTLIDPNDPSKGFTNQVACPGAAGVVNPLVVGGVPLDTNTGTQFTGFLAGEVTWAPAGTTTWQTSAIFDGAGSRDSGTGSKYHAASLVACLDCHGGSSPSYAGHEKTRLSEECVLCHYANEPGIGNQFRGINAGGFGMGLTSAATDTGSEEVHKTFVASPDSVGVFGGRYAPASNDACIACHTHVAVSIQYTRPNTLVFAANEGAGSNTGNWAVSGFTTAGSTVTTSTSTYPVLPNP